MVRHTAVLHAKSIEIMPRDGPSKFAQAQISVRPVKTVCQWSRTAPVLSKVTGVGPYTRALGLETLMGALQAQSLGFTPLAALWDPLQGPIPRTTSLWAVFGALQGPILGPTTLGFLKTAHNTNKRLRTTQTKDCA